MERIPRKLKKRLIKVFGRGTYKGIKDGYLGLRKYHKNHGVETIYTSKLMGECFFHAHQYNPYLSFPNLN